MPTYKVYEAVPAPGGGLQPNGTTAGYVEAPTREAGVPPPRLVIIPSPYRQLYAPLMELLTELEKIHEERQIAVIIPELVERRWYHHLLHNKTAAVLKAYLYFSGLQRVVVINVPWYLSC